MKKLLVIFSVVLFSGISFLACAATNVSNQPQANSLHPTGLGLMPTKKIVTRPKTDFNSLLAFFDVSKIKLTSNTSTVRIEGKLSPNDHMTVFGEGVKTSENIINYMPTSVGLDNFSKVLTAGSRLQSGAQDASDIFMHASFGNIFNDFISPSVTKKIDLPIALLTGDKHVLFINATSLQTSKNGRFIISGVTSPNLSNITISPNTSVSLQNNVIAIFANNTKVLDVDNQGRIAAQYKLAGLSGTQHLDILDAAGNSLYKITLKTR